MQPISNNQKSESQLTLSPHVPNKSIKNSSHLLPSPSTSEVILNIAKQNPGLTTTLTTSLTSFTFRLLTSPINASIDQMFFKKLGFMDALKVVKMNGLYRGAFVGSSSAFVGTGSYFGSLEMGASLYSIHTGMPIEEARKNTGVKLMAGIAASSLTTPLDYIRIQKQNASKDKPINFTARNLMRGNIPMSAVVIGTFVVGLGLGDKFSNELKPVIENDTTRELAAKICGIFMGNFMFSPLFNLSKQMKYSHSGIIQGLRNMGVVYDPAKYQPDHYVVNSKLRRLIYGMPINPITLEGLEKLTIKPHQYVKLSAETLAKNYKMGWKGFATASPLILMSCLSLALATQLAKNTLNQDKAQESTPCVEVID